MAEFKVGTGQTLDYRRSVHAERLLVKRDTAAPACNDCHGNHGAYPPGAQSVAEVCGQCHVAMKELFVASPHKAAFERSRLPQCVTCHGNHEIHPADDSLLGTGDVATCVGCHLPDSKGYAAATAMRAAVDELVREIDEAEAVLAEAAELGMEVSEAEFEFQGARANLVETRTLVHAFDADTLEASAAQGLEVARNAKQAGRAAIAELGSRQLMALLPLGLIGLVAALLYAKIRAVDRDQPPDDTGS
jgi:nitrate/TMAO reductase-like tetraheme cytochrome c subunit